jgi:hypothetical protein
MARGLKFVEGVAFADERAADEWICNHAEKWGEALAVPLQRPGGDTYLIGAWCAS